MHLNVNINYIANLRNNIKENEPDIIKYSRYCEKYGADGIAVYYNPNLKLFSSYDIKNLKLHVKSQFILKIAPNDSLIELALDVKPDIVYILPDVNELSPSSGFDISKCQKDVQEYISKLKSEEILTGVFVEPEIKQINAAYKAGLDYVELNTGNYSKNFISDDYQQDYIKLKESAVLATTLGMKVSLSKNINHRNIQPLVKIPSLSDITIGHGIISKAVYIGLHNSIKEIRTIIDEK